MFSSLLSSDSPQKQSPSQNQNQGMFSSILTSTSPPQQNQGMFSSLLSSSDPPKQNQSQGLFSSLLSSSNPPPKQSQSQSQGMFSSILSSSVPPQHNQSQNQGMFSSLLSSSNAHPNQSQSQSQGIFSSILSSTSPAPKQNSTHLFSNLTAKPPKTILEIAIENEEKELQEAKSSSKEFDLELAPILTSLGKKYHENSQYEKSFNTLNETLSIYIFHKKTESREYASAMNLMCLNQIPLTKYAEAQSGFLICLKILGPANDDNALEIADVYQNLSRVYRLLDKDADAASYLQKAIDILLKYHGENHELTIKAFLVQLERKEEGDEEKDIELANSYLSKLQEIKGEGHSDLIFPLYLIADFYSSKKDAVKVREYCEKALQIIKKYYGENCYWACRIYYVHGYNEIDEENYEKAYGIFEKYGKIVASVFKWYHPFLVYSKKGLAECLSGLKRYSAAGKEIQSAIEISTKLYNETHSLTMSCYKKMGWLLEAQKKYEEAIPVFQKCLEIVSRTVDTKEFVSLYRIIGDLCSKIRNHSAAVHCFQTVVDYQQKMHGEESEFLVNDLRRLSMKYSDIKDYNREIECLKRAIKIIKKKHGKDDFELHRFYVKLGRAYSDLKQDEKAIKKYKKCMEMRIKEYGADSKAVINVSHLLARSYVRVKEDAEAAKLLMNCLKVELREELPGEDAMDSFDDLANIYDIRKDFVNSQNFMKKAVQISGDIFKNSSSTRRKLRTTFFGIERDAALGKHSDNNI